MEFLIILLVLGIPVALISNYLIKRSDNKDEDKREAKGRNRNQRLDNLNGHTFRFASAMSSSDLVSRFLSNTQLRDQPEAVKPTLYIGKREGSANGEKLTMINGSLARSRFQIILSCTDVPGGCQGNVAFVDTNSSNTDFRDDIEEAEQYLVWVEQHLLALGITAG